MPTLLQYIFFYILAAVMLFQGLHFFQETKAPLGTVPEEVQQDAGSSRKWGALLLTCSALALGMGLLSHSYAAFRSAILPFNYLGGILLAVFAVWVVFMGRTVEYLGTPSDDGHHGHAPSEGSGHGHT